MFFKNFWKVGQFEMINVDDSANVRWVRDCETVRRMQLQLKRWLEKQADKSKTCQKQETGRGRAMRRVHWAKAKHENQEARERRIARTVDMDMGWLGRDRRLNVERWTYIYFTREQRLSRV